MCRGSQLAGKADWSVADEDDCSGIIKGILEPKPEEEEGQQEPAAAAEAQPAAFSSSDEVDSGSKAQAGTVRSSRSRSRVKAGTSSSPAATTSSSSSSSSKSKAKAPAKSSSRKSSEAGGEEVNANMVSYFRKQISAMKNFVESTHRWEGGRNQCCCQYPVPRALSTRCLSVNRPSTQVRQHAVPAHWSCRTVQLYHGHSLQ